jgi:hypothetical protein
VRRRMDLAQRPALNAARALDSRARA